MDEVIGYVDTRAAEVATTAIASDVAQVHQDMLDADADATAAAASAAAAAGTLANAVKKTGEASQSIAGDIAVAGDLTGGTVTVPTPVNNTDAASKKYVDDQDALLVPITDINQHAVGLTGNQNPIAGQKTFTSPLTINSDGVSIPFFVRTKGNPRMMQLSAKDYDVTDGIAHYLPSVLTFCDKNDVVLFRIGAYSFPNGRIQIKIYARNSDGSYKESTLIEGDTI